MFSANSSGSLSEIPEELFKYNTKVTNFAWAFSYQKKITTVPADLFVNNTNVSSFKGTFFECSELKELPKGLLAKNLKAVSFINLFGNCSKLKLNKYIFIADDSEAQTRFATVTSVIRFDNIFQRVGNNITNGDYGTCPDLWNYTYSSAGYGWQRTGSSYSGYTYYLPFYESTYWKSQASSLGKGWAKAEDGDSNWHVQSK